MTRTKRDVLKRKIGYCMSRSDTIIEHALDVRAEFLEYVDADPNDVDYMDQLEAEADENRKARFVLLLEMGMMAALKTQQMFEQFAQHAWGYVPDKVERWTGTGQDYREREES